MNGRPSCRNKASFSNFSVAVSRDVLRGKIRLQRHRISRSRKLQLLCLKLDRLKVFSIFQYMFLLSLQVLSMLCSVKLIAKEDIESILYIEDI